ncbi:MAG: NAD(P)/FAD-dependent oxidoreductase [Hyphomicrobiales bacterium]
MPFHRLYHASAYDPEVPVESFWQTTIADDTGHEAFAGEAACDVAVIGAGFTGLSAALRLAGRHGRDVRVLDAAWPGWGASGRNGGFCCMGGAKLSDAGIAARYGAAEAERFTRAQLDAVDLVASLLERHGIDADKGSGGEFQLAHRPGRMHGFEAEAEDIAGRFGVRADVYDRAGLERLGLAGPEFHGGLHTHAGFSLNPLKYVLGLARAAAAAGVRIHGRSPVVRLDLEDGGHKLHTPSGTLGAKAVIVATNGYSSENLPGWLGGRVLPVLSNILVTRPLSAAELEAQGWTTGHMAYDTRKLLHYFRLLPDGRFLFGARGGTDAAPAAKAAMKRRLRRDVERMFPAWARIDHSHFWTGLACLTYGLVPYVGAIGDHRSAWTALAYHGNGVAMGTWSGRQVAELAAGAATPDALPGVVRGPFGRFPVASLRKAYLNCAYAIYALRDEYL